MQGFTWMLCGGAADNRADEKAEPIDVAAPLDQLLPVDFARSPNAKRTAETRAPSRRRSGPRGNPYSAQTVFCCVPSRLAPSQASCLSSCPPLLSSHCLTARVQARVAEWQECKSPVLDFPDPPRYHSAVPPVASTLTAVSNCPHIRSHSMSTASHLTSEAPPQTDETDFEVARSFSE